MKTLTAPKNRKEYRELLFKRWYSLSAIEAIRKAIEDDENLDESVRDELLRLIDRRITEMVDARLDGRE